LTTLIDGNTDLIGYWVDNVLRFITNVFGGLASFGTTMGILLGVTFVIVLILAALGKIKISNIVGNITKK